MNTTRRKFLLGVSAAGLGTMALGYLKTFKYLFTFGRKGEKPRFPIYGNVHLPEILKTKATTNENGNYVINKDYYYANTVCIGCTTQCGVRIKVDKKTGKVVRVFGNPYNLLSSDPWLDYNKSIKESIFWVSGINESGLTNRSTVCARGNLVFDKLYTRYRVTKPLKRVGPRGSNKWVEIEPEQLIQEIVNGGNLFGEGFVEGLKSIRDINTPIDPNNPEYGPKSNQLGILGTNDDGRKTFIVHRFVKAFGTVNFSGHTSMCGLAMRIGQAAYFGDFKKLPHAKPDFDNTEYILSIGTAPAQAGNPFKRQGKLLARARTEGPLKKVVVVTPTAVNSDNMSIGAKYEWVPIYPGQDLAFVMGLFRYIIENNLYNAPYLSIPSEEAMKAAKEVSYTNATHLVIQDQGEDYGKILRDQNGDPYVIDAATNSLQNAKNVRTGVLFVDQQVSLNGKTYNVKSAFQLLKEAAFEYSLDEYSQMCGLPKETIVRIAKEFTSYGRKATTDIHGGAMNTVGMYAAYAVAMLGAMVGNMNYKGGMTVHPGPYNAYKGPIYDLLNYDGKVKTHGVRIDRAGFKYQNTTEYKTKKAQGLNPYPAKDKWYPFSNAIESDWIASSAHGYPYSLKALITVNSNPAYAQSGFSNVIEYLKDPKKIPLFIAIDPFINETSTYADYIVPDNVLYEEWGAMAPWGAYLTKITTIRYPAIESPNAKFKNGEAVYAESFFIELGKALNLPGFGDNAIKGKDGKTYPLHRPHDFYLRAFENLAMQDTPVPDATDEDIELAGLTNWVPLLKSINGNNWRKVATIMSRGGRYAPYDTAYDGIYVNHKYKKILNIYNEELGSTQDAITGEYYHGVPKYIEGPICADGSSLWTKVDRNQYSLIAFGYKSNVLSSPNASSDKLRDIKLCTYIDINSKTAKEFGIKYGDLVKVSNPFGQYVIGIVRVKEGIMPGTIGIEHGLGRLAEGADTIYINNKKLPAMPLRQTGVNLNMLGMQDPSRPKGHVLADFVSGSQSRNVIPVKIEKIRSLA